MNIIDDNVTDDVTRLIPLSLSAAFFVVAPVYTVNIKKEFQSKLIIIHGYSKCLLIFFINLT